MDNTLRLKLDKRIRNQRLALRENWEIVERRRAGSRRHEHWLFKRIGEICDQAGIPRNCEGGGLWSIGWRMSELERILKGQTDAE